MSDQVFSATIALHNANQTILVADRIASRRFTQGPQPKCSPQGTDWSAPYRDSILRALQSAAQNPVTGEKFVAAFKVLAENLEHAKALALPIEGNSYDSSRHTLEETWHTMLGGEAAFGGKLLDMHADSQKQRSIQDGLLHPLLIALLAYRMGGPINAAHTAFAHQWKLPADSRGPTDLANFHMEGDNGNNDSIFDDHRITLVWEEYHGALRGASGSHHIFESGKSSDSQLLKSADLITCNGVGTASTILYNAKDATLFYQSDERDAVRNSITLSFQLESTDDELHMLVEPAGAVQVEDAPSTLSELVLNNPGPGYSNSFQRLLLGPESLRAITEKLSKIRMAPMDPPPASDVHPKLQQQADAYKEDNLARIPADILAIEHDIIISGIHSSAENFFGLLCVKARRDVHLPLGWEFLPQDPMDEHRERARKFIRDMPNQSVYARLKNYVQAITGSPYTASDLLSTGQLQQLATSIETRAYELLTDGFIDPSHVLNSIPSFVGALGQVLNGEKEWGRFPQMHVKQYDFQVYRTRCLYLFWCADWLAYYNGKTVDGPFMVREVGKDEMDKGRRQMVWAARMLVRNWVAWGLFGEAVPQEFVIT